MAYPSISMGVLPKDMPYRFNWNAPIITCPHDPSTIFHAANVVLKTTDGGFNWDVISPDLTRNDKSKQGPGGVPFTNEGAGGETYNTISYLACSPHEPNVIWVGSDDGLVHLTRDGGKKWTNVSPPDLEEALIHSIEVSPHDPKAAYIVATRYKFDDLKPYIYYTDNYGKNWVKITSGIISTDFVKVVREDPIQRGLLYAGTESGLYISFNNGEQWDRFQLNLPVCPITDLLIHDNDLIASTSGRSIWILDDLSSIQQSMGQLFNGEAVLFKPKKVYRFKAETPDKPVPEMGQNPLNGVIIDYYLPQLPDSSGLAIQILKGEQVIRSYSNQMDPNQKTYEGGPMPDKILSSMKGINRFHWDLQRVTLPSIPDVFVMGNYTGSLVAPGEYTIRMIFRSDTLEQVCKVLPDPRLEVSTEEYQAQQIVLLQIENAVKDIHLSVNRMRDVKGQIITLTQRLEKIDRTEEIVNAGKNLVLLLNSWEEKLIQPRQKTYQDVINFPNKLSAELLDLKNRVDTPDPRITSGTKDRLKDLLDEWHKHKIEMTRIIEEEVAIFNQLYRKGEIPALIVPSTGGSGITSDGKE